VCICRYDILRWSSPPTLASYSIQATFMAAQLLTRGLGVYHLLFAVHLFWDNVLQRIVALAKGYGTLIEVPLLLLPSLILIAVCLYSGCHLLLLSPESHAISSVVQSVLVITSLFLMLIVRPLDATLFLLHTVLLLLLVHPSMTKVFSTPRGIWQWQAGVLKKTKRYTVGLISLSVVTMVLWCGVSMYSARTMSAYNAMVRLVPTTEGPVHRETIRSSLLKQLPIGSPTQAITTYLEQHGVPVDTFRGGQFVRYQMSQGHVLALFSNPPWVIDIICSQVHYGVRFVIRDDQLLDIVIENYTRCL
jgi:hypothetical protein